MKLLLIFNIIFLSISNTLAITKSNPPLENTCYGLSKEGDLVQLHINREENNMSKRCHEEKNQYNKTQKTAEGQYVINGDLTQIFKIAVQEDMLEDGSVALEMSTRKRSDDVKKYSAFQGEDYSKQINQDLSYSDKTVLSSVSRNVSITKGAPLSFKDQTSCERKFDELNKSVELFCTTISLSMCNPIYTGLLAKEKSQLEIVQEAFSTAYGNEVMGRHPFSITENRKRAQVRLVELNRFANKGRTDALKDQTLNTNAYRNLIDKIIKAKKNDSEMEAVAKDIVRRCKKYFPPSSDSSQKQSNDNK